jgi:hypothetical protein
MLPEVLDDFPSVFHVIILIPSFSKEAEGAE